MNQLSYLVVNFIKKTVFKVTFYIKINLKKEVKKIIDDTND